MSLKPSYKVASKGKSKTFWAGVIKDGAGRVVWTCDHKHNNREMVSSFNPVSAVTCARREILRRRCAEMEAK